MTKHYIAHFNLIAGNESRTDFYAISDEEALQTAERMLNGKEGASSVVVFAAIGRGSKVTNTVWDLHDGSNETDRKTE